MMTVQVLIDDAERRLAEVRKSLDALEKGFSIGEKTAEGHRDLAPMMIVHNRRLVREYERIIRSLKLGEPI